MTTINRRDFLGTAAVAAAAGAVALSASAAEAPAAPAKIIKIGLIGCGWYGMVDVEAALKSGGVEIVALCDVDADHLKASADKVEKLQAGKRPATHKLYTDLLNTPGLEAVIIGTPPQWHALQFLAALEKNLDVYCEKPLAYDVREGRAMADAAKKSDRIVQIGFQRRQAEGFRQAREHINAGNIGKVIAVDAQIHYSAGTKDPTPKDPPAALDWDLWCGPGPKIPYSDQVGHMNWRLEKTSGHGHLVDWGIHLIDATRWVLGESLPRAVSATGGLYVLQGKITTPDTLTATFEFERCPVTWRHRIWGAAEFTPDTTNGVFFYGEKETLFVTDNRWVTIPRAKGKERQTHETKSDAGLKHVAEWLDAVRTRKQPSCLTEDAHRSTTTVKLAMIALEAGARITYDPATEQITNHPDANKLLKREYRSPYQHPFKG